MEGPSRNQFSRTWAVSIALGLFATAAHASSIDGYTVTDLGAGQATITTNASGQSVVVTPDGKTAYDFSRTSNAIDSSNPVMQKFPPFTNAPVWASMTYGDPKNAYSTFASQGLFLNQNGVFVGTNEVGVYGHIQAAGSTLLAAMPRPDGTPGPLNGLWSTPFNHVYPNSGAVAEAYDLNNRNQVLGRTYSGFTGMNTSYSNAYQLYDLNTGKLTPLSPLLPNWHIDSALALDDLGRILLTANQDKYENLNWITYPDHTLLLTPDGVSSEPVPIPEPTTLAVLALGLGGLALRHRSARIKRIEMGSDRSAG